MWSRTELPHYDGLHRLSPKSTWESYVPASHEGTVWREGDEATAKMKLLVWALIGSEHCVCKRSMDTWSRRWACTHTHSQRCREDQREAGQPQAKERGRKTNQISDTSILTSQPPEL